MKLILGTAQLGINSYGITNKYSLPPSIDSAFELLTFARQHSITRLDTAFSYGKSHHFIGRYQQDNLCCFKITSKISVSELIQKNDNKVMHLDSIKKYKSIQFLVIWCFIHCSLIIQFMTLLLIFA